MRQISLFLLFLLFLTSCLPKQEIVRRTAPDRRDSEPQRSSSTPTPAPVSSPTIGSSTNLARSTSAEAYIAHFKDIAISEMDEYGIPASIKLAQALLESGNGNSSLARNSNNHFGIKCTTTWQGRTVLKSDDNPDDCFRVYNNPEESFRDHSEFLLRARYSALFKLDKDDYVGWARGLKSAGYATNPRYAELLISLIERYDLHQYDKPETRREKVQREEVILTEIVQEMPQEAKKQQAQPTVVMSIHEVRTGDTLFSISQRYSLTVDELKILNNLNGEGVSVGQLLLVSK
jgi:flagellum-specific peptidoglycan hydrolase FlgJ